VTELVIDTYLNLLRAKLLLGVAVDAERVAHDQLDRTQALYELGSSARSDVLKQQVQHNQTRLNLVRANQLERQAHVDLEWAMNLEHETPSTSIRPWSQIQYKTKDFRSSATMRSRIARTCCRSGPASWRRRSASGWRADAAADARFPVQRGTQQDTAAVLVRRQLFGSPLGLLRELEHLGPVLELRPDRPGEGERPHRRVRPPAGGARRGARGAAAW
jgi:hypothetical protein